MPSLELTTNVKINNPKDFALEFSKLSSDVLAKPEKWFTVRYIYNETLTFGGTFDPAFILNIICLDTLSVEANEKSSKIFFDFFQEKLGVPGDRGYITFVDPGRGYIGHQGTTFATIFGNL